MSSTHLPGTSGTIERTTKPPYLVIDGRRMIPDFESLVSRGYEYLSVGGKLLKPESERGESKNGRELNHAEKELLRKAS
jgi:hypothetical protein